MQSNSRNSRVKKDKNLKELQDVFMKFHQKIVAALRREAKNLPFTLSQLEAMRFVIAEKNPTMKDIAAHLNVTAPSATAMIEQLAEKNLVSRRLNSTDRRTVRIQPTTKAAKFFSSFDDAKARIFGRMFASIKSEDQKALTEILKKLI